MILRKILAGAIALALMVAFPALAGDMTGSNTLNAATSGAEYRMSFGNGQATASFSVKGLTASGATLSIEGSDDGGTTWSSINGVSPSTGLLFTTLTTDQQFRVNVGGRTNARLRVSSTGSGTITIASNISLATSLMSLSSALPPGTNTIGAVTGALGTSGGWTPGTATALTNSATAIKASAGQLGKILCYNPNAAVAYVQIFNIASGSVSLGTSTPVDVVPVPATLNGGWTLPFPGEQFSTAISFAATTTPTGSTAMSTALTCSYGYN